MKRQHASQRVPGWLLTGAIFLSLLVATHSKADSDVKLLGVPDYSWFAGCFGTATGNLMGYWDRHGFPDFYKVPTAGGVAPLNDAGANSGIHALWVTQAGVDGRPAGQYGHMNDYYSAYESRATDPYKTAGRAEHAADCIGDFIGLNQRKWTNLNNECDGNIDGYSFVYWDTAGDKRVDFVPPAQGTNQVRDIPSGLREWSRYRGYDAEVFSQLVNFNPNCPAGHGLTFADLQAEIDAGYPVLVFLQPYDELYRSLSGMPKANPEIHGMLIYGYEAYEGLGTNVICRTSWASGDNISYSWSATPWVETLAVRGIIGFHPKPRLRSIGISGLDVTLNWDGPSSQLQSYDISGFPIATTSVHRYQLERSLTLDPPDFHPLGNPTTSLTITVPDCCFDAAYYRVQLLPP